MPLYEYWCPECKKTFEKLRPMGSKDDEVKCMRCGAAVKKMLSVFATVGSSDSDETDLFMSHGGCACGGSCGCRTH